MAAAALRKLFRPDRHRISSNDASAKKNCAEERNRSRRFFSLCSGNSNGPKGRSRDVEPDGTPPVVPARESATGASASKGSSLMMGSTRSPSHRVAPAENNPPVGAAGAANNALAVRTRRLMREYREISRQQLRAAAEMRPPTFTVDLVDDNLFEWHVRLYMVDPESQLWRDMQEAGLSCVQLHVSFPDNFPFAPPFVRVLAPHVEKGFVMEGGAICMELLTPRGWASAYTVEAVLVQVAASLSKGQARISNRPGKQFNRKLAESSFRSLVKTHEKYGWVTPPLADG
ncbi:ubiquitin-conjugating enzyme E2Q-like protein 1 [Ornithodoros turicata]|uniref:ubiquitin-conjugating enzyme E2Q-like protein 1 n=1 Tax=Ornithodoros turicata TaxID=34597 RepID=UPI003138A0F4